jgi:hypothetical protein
MKRIFIVLLFTILVFSANPVNASYVVYPIPDPEWEMEIASYVVVTNSSNQGWTTSILPEANETHTGLVVQIYPGYSVKYRVYIQRADRGLTNWHDYCGGDVKYEGEDNLLQFGPSESNQNQPFDDYIECDPISIQYEYRVLIKDTHLFKTLTTTVTVWKEDLS